MSGSSRQTTTQSLKIFMTADAAGGVWQYSIDLVKGLAQQGAQVLLATMGPRPTDAQKEQLRSITRVSLAESDFALEWMPNPWADVAAAGPWLLDLAGSFKADLIHLNGYSHANLQWQKPVLVAAHSCVFSWWHAVHGGAPGSDWNEYKRRVVEGLTAADRIVAPSEYMASALESEYGVGHDKIQIIHNFSRAPRSTGRQKQNFILAAGRIWDAAKNLPLLEQIAPKLDWEIRLAGSETGPDSATPVSKSIQFLGVLPHALLLKEMDRASIFAHPALYEPFGLSVLEAARRQCCLVLADIPSLRALWDEAAIFIDPRDSERWISELNGITRQVIRRQQMARLASSRAAVYRTGTALAKYWRLYRSLLSPNTRNKEAAA